MRQTIVFWLFLVCIAVVLLAFLLLHHVRAAEQGPAAAPALTTGDDVALALPKQTPTPTAAQTPTPTPEPDKPDYNPAIPLSQDLQHILRGICEETGVEMALVLGLIEMESRFDPCADNGLCYGLMQLSRQYFPSNLPAGENIRYGVKYLGQLLTRYDTVEAALTAYNAGYDTGSRVYANAVLAAAERWRGVV